MTYDVSIEISRKGSTNPFDVLLKEDIKNVSIEDTEKYFKQTIKEYRNKLTKKHSQLSISLWEVGENKFGKRAYTNFVSKTYTRRKF